MGTITFEFFNWEGQDRHRAIRWHGRWLIFLLICASQILRGADAPVSRLWTDQDGRHYDATILSLYKNQVTFRRPDGRTFTLGLDDLATADQLAVHEWLLKQPEGEGVSPPPTTTLSPFGRQFILDEPRVIRVRPLPNKGYASAYLGIPLTVRPQAGASAAEPLEFVNVYFYDEHRKQIPFPLPPSDQKLEIVDGDTTSAALPADFKPGQTYTIIIPLRDQAVRTAPYAVVVAGNNSQVVAAVFPEGSWRDFNFPEHDRVALDKYADYAGQELYTGKNPSDLFEMTDVTRLQPRTGDHSPEHDYFRLTLSIHEPFPAAALAGAWYAFDKDHHLLHAEDIAPYTQRDRKDGLYIIALPGRGPADITDAILPTQGEVGDLVQLPGAAWWDRPEVDSIVFVFGSETKKIARVFSKSGAALGDLPVPEKAAFAGASPSPQAEIPLRQY